MGASLLALGALDNEIVRDVREEGSRCSSGKRFISNSVSESSKYVSEGSVCKQRSPFLINLAMILSLPKIVMYFNLEGKASGDDSISGQPPIDNIRRDGKVDCICSGNDFKLVQSQR
ncbi:hypothetical protein F3Y22_tig00110621pilonHSYRG00447 [Hibiscus syriacus]|uniref:Uncharacterized protein n=1 Tax=Hibiscus syriacus TaxID=106335 RepID=A0A6A2ZZV0_HIBSY|nr:hypothetical protein F3Y22_tig00110621pilonHSYRG00447 [Hibiscus syriacus]